MEGVAFAEHLEELDPSRDDHRGQGIGEEVGARTLAQHVDDLLAAGGESAHGAAEGLAQGAGVDVDSAVAAELLGDAAARLSDHAGAVALVHHHQGVVFLREVADLVHRGDVAVHREDAVGDDDAEPLGLGFLQAALEVCHVGVRVAVADRLAQAHAVDDGGMVERVGDDGVLGREQGLEHAAVGIEAGGIQNRVFGVEVVGDGLLELFMEILGPADETDRRHPVAAAVHGLLRRLDQARVVREAEVVVGAEIECLGSVLEGDLGALGGADVALVLVQAGFFDGSQLLDEMLLEFSVHGR